MFKKYKEQKEKRTHLGMSKREYYKMLIIAFGAILCLTVIVLKWGNLTGTQGTDVSIPKPEETIELPIERPQGTGEEGKKEKFERALRELRKRHEPGEDEPGELELPEIPRPATPWEPAPEIWSQVDDGAVDQLEEQVVYYVLHQLNSMTQEEIDRQVVKDGCIPSSDYASRAADYRGKFVSITGTLMVMDNPLPLDLENRSGVGQVWDGIIYNQRQKDYRKFYFYIFDKDREWFSQEDAKNRRLTRGGDLVTLNGVFVKLYRNHIKDGRIETYPFIVGRRLKAARGLTVTGQYPWTLLIPVGIGLAAVFIILFMATHRDRKADEAFLRSRKQKRGVRVSNELVRRLTGKSKGKAAAEAEEEQNPLYPPAEPKSPDASAEEKSQSEEKEPGNSESADKPESSQGSA